MVEMRGVEPLSESLPRQLSTSLLAFVYFPLQSPWPQKPKRGSFIKSAPPQSFGSVVARFKLAPDPLPNRKREVGRLLF